MGSPTVLDSPAFCVPDPCNIAAYFIDRNLELGRGDNIAVYEEARQFNYAQLAEMVNRTGNALRALGIEAENRVLVALPDSAEFIAAFFGAAKIGAVPVPINPASPPAHFLYYLTDTGAKALVVQEELWPQLEATLAQARSMRHVLLVRAPSGTSEIAALATAAPQARYNCHSYCQLLADASPTLEAEPTSKDDIAFFLYTSGSTGEPKGVVHLQHDMLFATEGYANGILRIQEQDIVFSAPKMFFAYGLGTSMYFPLSAGAAAVLYPHRPKPEVVFDYIKRFRPTLFFGVPTLYAAMLHSPGERDLSSIRFAVSAGEVLPPEIFYRVHERFGLVLHDTIGSTEMLHLFISNPPGEVRLWSSGKPVPGYEAKIMDDSGNVLPPGQIGNLWVKGDSSSPFYWRKHELTKRAMRGEWVVTGDKYYADEEGYYFFCGRADDMLKVAGYWVSPAEVENALLGFPGVLEAAVVGKEDEHGLIKPKAFVVMTNGAAPPTEDALRTFVREKLPGYKCPRWLEFVGDLPKTPTGKIQRFKLRAR